MLLTLNIGNTNTQMGWHADSAVSGMRVVASADWDIAAIVALAGSAPVAVASVVPAKSAALRAALPDMFEVDAAAAAAVLNLDAIDRSTIGADRLAAAAALSLYHELPAVVIDFGTAITFDVVAPGRRHLGGLIAPGRRLARLALARHTAQLPEIPLYDIPPEPIGTNTIDAIRSGIDRGLLRMVEGTLADYAEALGVEKLNAFAIGGDAAFLARHARGIKIAPAGDDFVLRGVAAIWNANGAADNN